VPAAVRNHVIDFLVSRSRTFAKEAPGHDSRRVAVVRPGFIEPAIAASTTAAQRALSA